MKVRHLFIATVGLMAAVACNDEEFATSGSAFDGKGELVQVDGLTISLTKGNDVQTRAIDANGGFWWMPANLGLPTETPEKIGLCWTGVNNVNPDKAPLTVTGNMVYTNYEFVQAGWLYDGYTKPEMSLCPDAASGEYYVTNGEYNKAANAQAPSVTATLVGGATNATSYKATTSGKTLDLTTAFFTTKNTAIYSGEYIVYYPYTGDFFDSPIVASAPRALTLEANAASKYAAMSKYGFNVGYVGEFQGGQLSDSFVTTTLSGAVYLGLANTGAVSKTIKQVTLYAAGADDNFIIKQELNASAIKAAKNIKSNIGTNLYLGNPTETSKTIVANYDTPKVISTDATGKALAYVVLPVLPTTINDLKILLIDEDDKVAIVECGRQELKSLAVTSLTETFSYSNLIDLKNVEFDADYYVTDYASLKSVVASIEASTGTVAPSATHPVKVQVVGDITLEQDITIGGTSVFNYVTFEGDKIIVPADVTLTLSQNPTINCAIDIMDKGCCGTKDGALVARRAVLGGDINNRGDITIGVSGTQTAVSMNDVTLNNLKGEETVRGNKIAYSGTITVEDNVVWTLNGSSNIVNEGSIEVIGIGQTAKDGTITLAQGSTASIDNQGSIVNGGNINILSSNNGLKNSTTTSEFVDKVGSQLTGYGMNSDNQGEFICEVDAQHRYTTALTSNIRPTTIVRFVDEPSDATSYGIASGDIKNVATKELVSFEVKAAGKTITFTPATTDGVSTIKSLTVTEATKVNINKLLKVNEDANINANTDINKNLVVVEALNINNGTVAVAEKVNVNDTTSTCDLTVGANGKMTLANDGKSYFDAITNNGSVDIAVATVTPNVAHELWCNSFAGSGKWANNSYPMIR